MHKTKRQTYQKKTWSDPFINILPSIDLHGYSRDLIYTPVNDFINDNLKLGKKKIVVVHGIGEGILKEELTNLINKVRKKELAFKDGTVEKYYEKYCARALYYPDCNAACWHGIGFGGQEAC